MESTSSSFTELLDYFIDVDIESLSPAAATSAQKAEIVSALKYQTLCFVVFAMKTREEIDSTVLYDDLENVKYQSIDTPFKLFSKHINNISRSCLQILENLPPRKCKFTAVKVSYLYLVCLQFRPTADR